MQHIGIMYNGVIAFISITTFLTIYTRRDRKNYLKYLLLSYLFFSIITLSKYLSSYISVNIPELGREIVVITSVISSFFEVILIYFALLTVHRIINISRKKLELYTLVVIIVLAILLYSPLCYDYVNNRIILNTLVRVSQFIIIDFFLYFLFIIIKNIRNIVDRKALFLLLLLGVFILIALVETLVSIYLNRNATYLNFDDEQTNILVSTIIFTFISLYAIYLVMGKSESEVDLHLLQTSGYTLREAEVVLLILKGKPNKDIAFELNISLATVKKHIQNIFKKAGVSNRFQLAQKLRKT